MSCTISVQMAASEGGERMDCCKDCIPADGKGNGAEHSGNAYYPKEVGFFGLGAAVEQCDR